MTDVIARRVVVHGQVQGVFFRDSCRREATARQVVGWVSNEYDGTVRAHFEGSPEDVDALVRWVHAGPQFAAVQSVEVADAEVEQLSGFEIR